MDWIKENKKIWLYVIFIIGFLVRLVAIDKYPTGLNVDEASIGYEAYSILNYGIDRNNNLLPIYLVAWGSGQNALYGYILIPFIKILGLSLFTIRLPMALIGCISLFIMYKLLKNITNEKITLLGTFFFAICPWHIMKSRWALESNIFPDIILLAVFLLIYGLKNKKRVYMYISFVVFGISAYAYATSYFFLPIFLGILLFYLVKKKEIDVKHAIQFFIIVFVITLPMIIFVIINKFDLPQINLPFLTIPRLQENRFEELSSIFSGNFIITSLNNFVQSIKMLIFQNDNLPWNALKEFGIIYQFTLIFTLIGIVKTFEKKDIYSWIINIWLIVALLLLFICEPNINRCNIIIIPIIYYTIIGIYEVTNKIKYANIIIPTILLISFLLFIFEYINTNYKTYGTFKDNVEEVINYVEKLDVENIYMEYSFKEPYIYVLFYTQANPHDFINTVEHFGEKHGFDTVKAFDKYKFYLPENINSEENAVYIIPKDEEIEFDKKEFKITNFKDFKVIEKME